MLAIGKIAKPQGLKGEMKILPFGDAEMFEVGKVFVDGREFAVESFSERPNGMFIKLAGVDSIDGANALKNKEIAIPIEQARQIIGSEKFLWGDAFDSEITTYEGKALGKVEDIDNFGASDVVFACDNSGKKFSFPIVKGLIVSIENKRVVVNEKRFDEVVCYED